MSDAPEKIFVKIWHPFNKLEGYWHVDPPLLNGELYIRADLHDALTAERDALKAEVEKLRGALDGCANWCEALIEAVWATPCTPEDPEAFDDALSGAQTFARRARAALGDTGDDI